MGVVISDPKGCTTILTDDYTVQCHYSDPISGHEFMLQYERKDPNNTLTLFFQGIDELDHSTQTTPKSYPQAKQIIWSFDPVALVECITKTVRYAKELKEDAFI